MREQLVDGVAAVLWFSLFGWTIPILEAQAGSVNRWQFAVGVASTSAWALVVGVALCEFTNAHAWLAGVVGV